MEIDSLLVLTLAPLSELLAFQNFCDMASTESLTVLF